MNGTHLQSVLLVVTCSGALVLRARDVEVVAQRQTYALGIGVHVLVCQTDGIVGGRIDFRVLFFLLFKLHLTLRF